MMKQVSAIIRRDALKKKLVAATAMLLVSAIMMVSTSYAWFVMATAPEVSNIKTQVGANGALEMALLSRESWTNLDLLDMGDIDESGDAPAVDSNLTWGNLVNLDDASYGLDKIVLNPARLYLATDGTIEGVTQYKVSTTLLKTPIYGEDGRVEGLNTDSAVAFVYNNGKFDTEGYGVRAIGTAASMSEFQLGMNAARSAIVTNAAAARTIASNTLNQTGGDLATIVVAYAVNNKADGYTVADVQAIRALAAGLQSALDNLETALRYVFAGFVATNDIVTSNNYAATVEAILIQDNTVDGYKTLTQLMTTYSGISTVIPGIGTYISTLESDQNAVGDAIDECDSYIGENRTYTWSEISNIVHPLADTNWMTVSGKTVEELKASLKNPDGTINYDEALKLVQGGVNIAVPSGSGILSDISDYAGDYSAKVTIDEVSAGGTTLTNVNANMTTATTANPVYLTACSNALRGATVSTATGSNAITDYYGYAIDLAFRTNAEESNLLLQTTPVNRVYEGDNSNASLQGGGSYMTFTTGASLSATKMVKLMSGIRVVLMDESQRVLAIAALDCTLGKDVYAELSAEEKASTGMWAYLDGSASSYQKSDLIDFNTFSRLPEKSEVIFDKTSGTVTAKLYLFNFSMKLNAKGHETGALQLDGKKNDAVITALEQDVIQRVTALVYIDGSVVNNSMVAANSAQSMSGKLNLQFASSAVLIPADNTALRGGESTPDTTPDTTPAASTTPTTGGES